VGRSRSSKHKKGMKSPRRKTPEGTQREGPVGSARKKWFGGDLPAKVPPPKRAPTGDGEDLLKVQREKGRWGSQTRTRKKKNCVSLMGNG